MLRLLTTRPGSKKWFAKSQPILLRIAAPATTLGITYFSPLVHSVTLRTGMFAPKVGLTLWSPHKNLDGRSVVFPLIFDIWNGFDIRGD